LRATSRFDWGGRAFDILVVLIERAGELVTKEALIARVWPQSISGPVHERGIRAEDAARRRMASRLPPADPRSALCPLSLAPWAPDHPAAEEYFRRALDIANGQGALSWELRIGLSLCRLRVTQGRGDEGRRLLAAIYSRFSEGFGTADLVAAKQLLHARENAESS
jgi:hypothetical protein